MQVARQLEMEKAALLEAKRREQEERRRKQEELDQILLENRRKVTPSALAGRLPLICVECHRLGQLDQILLENRRKAMPGASLNETYPIHMKSAVGCASCYERHRASSWTCSCWHKAQSDAQEPCT